MAVRLRLSRHGAKKNPHYLIVAVDQSKKRDGAHLERLGQYNPKAKKEEDKVRIDMERLRYWHQQGAQPSQTVAELLKALGYSKQA